MSGTAPMPPRRVRRAFLAFEGGGAKGLIHVGALHAIEDSGRFRPVGFAGTSAGSMIATLAAAGYSAEEIFALAGAPYATQEPPFDPVAFRTILTTLGHRDATAIFGEATWRSLRWFRALLGARTGSRMPVGPVALLVLLAAITVWGGWAWAWALLGLVGGASAVAARLVWGGARLDGVRAAFDAALWRKFPEIKAEGRRVTFADLPNLKICAANLTRRRLELFSEQTSPDVAVADAVAASVCFPFAFRPVEIAMRRPDRSARRELFLDGGLLSNLPAWPFDEERRLDPDALTLAIAIRDGERPAPPTQFDWVRALVRTAIFGGEVLSTRGAGPIEVLRLRTDIALLDFDMPKRQAFAEVVQARNAARALLNARVLDFPDLLRQTTAGLREAIGRWQVDVAAEFGLDAAEADIRVSLALPENHLDGGFWPSERWRAVRSLTLRYGAGYEGWADEGMVLPLKDNTVGEAWRPDPTRGLRREPQFAFLDDLDDAFQGDENAHRARRVRPGLAWVLGVPLRLRWLMDLADEEGDSPASLDGALVVDSTLRIPTDAIQDAFVIRILGLIHEEIKPRLPRDWMELDDAPRVETAGRRDLRGR